MPIDAHAEERWVVVKATAPHWFTLQVPRVIARVIPLRSDLRRRDRQMIFLDRGPGVAQVVPVVRSTSDGAGPVAPRPALAVATYTDKLLFSMPSALRKHLGLRVSPSRIGRAAQTNDLVAWMVPEREWELSSAGDFSTPVRVYLTRSQFPARCEAMGSEGPVPSVTK